MHENTVFNGVPQRIKSRTEHTFWPREIPRTSPGDEVSLSRTTGSAALED